MRIVEKFSFPGGGAPSRKFGSRLVKKLMQHNCSTSITRRGAPDSVLGFGVFAGQLFPTGTGGRYLSLGGFFQRDNDP